VIEQLEAMDARLVDEALATLRAEAEEREFADRVRRLCDDAVDAARAKRRELEDKK
jgi:hypothetical protein